MKQQNQSLVFDYDSVSFRQSWIAHADCLEWLSRVPENSLHAIVTDPPYGVKEYDLSNWKNGPTETEGSGAFRPGSNGHVRAAPRFTALAASERERMRQFFTDWSRLVVRLQPGGHVFVATNAFIAQLLYNAIVGGGLEFRGQIIRLVRTLRGGDRPKTRKKSFRDARRFPRDATNRGACSANRSRRA